MWLDRSPPVTPCQVQCQVSVCAVLAGMLMWECIGGSALYYTHPCWVVGSTLLYVASGVVCVNMYSWRLGHKVYHTAAQGGLLFVSSSGSSQTSRRAKCQASAKEFELVFVPPCDVSGAACTWATFGFALLGNSNVLEVASLRMHVHNSTIEGVV